MLRKLNHLNTKKGPPTTRSEWSNLKWQDSQSYLGQLLNSFDFMKFEELRLSKGSRADIVVIRKTDEEIIFGVIEVKSYAKINSSVEKSAVKQVCRYITNLFELVNNNSKWGNRRKRYFGSVIFTNDYPISMISKSQDTIAEIIPTHISSNEDVHIFSSRPEELIGILQSKNLCGYNQNSLKDYFM